MHEDTFCKLVVNNLKVCSNNVEALICFQRISYLLEDQQKLKKGSGVLVLSLSYHLVTPGTTCYHLYHLYHLSTVFFVQVYSGSLDKTQSANVPPPALKERKLIPLISA